MLPSSIKYCNEITLLTGSAEFNKENLINIYICILYIQGVLKKIDGFKKYNRKTFKVKKTIHVANSCDRA